MPEDLNINSFDDLKAALSEALHKGGNSLETADYLMERFDVLCVDIDNVFLAISANDVKEEYPNLTIDEARDVRDDANENLWNSGGYCDINDVAWGQIAAEAECVMSAGRDSCRNQSCLDELAEAYGEDENSYSEGDLRDSDTHAR